MIDYLLRDNVNVRDKGTLINVQAWGSNDFCCSTGLYISNMSRVACVNNLFDMFREFDVKYYYI